MTVVGVVGLGVVGGTVAAAFDAAGIPVRGYDRYKGIGAPADLADCSVVFACVPTPSAPSGALDVREVWSGVETVEPYLADGAIVAVKSTVPPGTTDALAETFPRLEFASVPEFLVQARPMETFTRPDRVVIGARTRTVGAVLGALMATVAPTAPIILLEPAEAELAKLCSNAMLAAKVAMANELAEVCQRFGVAWPRVQSAVGLDRRIGPDHLRVTPEGGFGGGCLPKDLDGLIAAVRYGPLILEELAAFNRRVPAHDRGLCDSGGGGGTLACRVRVPSSSSPRRS